jgi:hypothetical protein
MINFKSLNVGHNNTFQRSQKNNSSVTASNQQVLFQLYLMIMEKGVYFIRSFYLLKYILMFDCEVWNYEILTLFSKC